MDGVLDGWGTSRALANSFAVRYDNKCASEKAAPGTLCNVSAPCVLERAAKKK